jgi:hypothetical protein
VPGWLEGDRLSLEPLSDGDLAAVAEFVEEFVPPIGAHGATASANTHRISATSRRTSSGLATSQRPTPAGGALRPSTTYPNASPRQMH